MGDLYWWETCFMEAMIEGDENLRLAKIDKALAAIQDRLSQTLEVDRDEELKLKAEIGLSRLRLP
jgi:hypothetical protein